MNNKTEIDYLNYNDLNLVEEKIKECTDRANEAMSPQINKIIDGKSTQETRSGKNLLNLPDGTYTNNGVTATVKGGIVTINGTATANSFINIPFNYTFLANTNYTLSANNTLTMSGENYIRFNYGTAVYFPCMLSHEKSKYTNNFSENTIVNVFVIRTENGKTYNNFVIKPQLEKGSTATSFEQYGASPSPDYPSEIENVKGKNLFKPTLATKVGNGITCTANKDGTYTLNGTATADVYFTIGDDSNLTVGKTYKFVGCPNGGSNTTYRMGWGFHGYEYGNGLVGKKTSEARDVQITIFKGVTVSNLIFKPMFTENTLSTYNDYVPYGNIQIVETGKNLFNVINYNNIKANTNHTTIIKNEKSINFTSQVYSVSGFFLITKDIQSYISNLDISKKYIISADVEVSDGCTIKFGWESDATFANIPKGKTRIKNKFTPTVPVVCYIINKSIDVKVTNIMVSLSDENYEPYTEEVVNIDLKGNELCSLPNGTKDELIVKDGRAKIIKRIGKVVLDGSEDWHRELSSGLYRFTISRRDFNRDGRREILSNYFKYYFTGHEVGLGFTAYTYLYLYPKQDITTVDEFKTWLSTHNTTVQYELREPYEIDLGPLEVYFTYETKKWVINELPYIQEIDRIEKGIYNLGEKYNRPKGWLTTKEWITKDNLYPIKGFDYRDWNRWVNNLNLFTTDIVVKDTIWNGASFINWEQIGKDEWR